VRAPVELYGLVPIFSSDGIEASYRHRFAGWTKTLQATLCRTDVDLPNGATAKIRDLGGLSSTLERALGATHDPGRWFVIAELGQIRTGSMLGDRTAGYATAGYRVRELAP
jgi:hypothetical protein